MYKGGRAIPCDKDGVPITGLSMPAYDYVTQTQSATQDVWVFKFGGSGGTTVATVTINYTDATKVVITNVAKT